MKMMNDNTVVKTNGEFSRQNFGIADMSIILELLTKLYGNPKQTLTQEYISNARDANRESGSAKPITINAPTKFNPIMTIRDYGVGLSPERISETFLFYGASTKRNDNKQLGGFGIGAKSAWAYVDSFTIITYIEGIKRTYVAHKSSGNGNLDLIDESSTIESNGTAIVIPVKPDDASTFRGAILRTVFYWEPKEKPELLGFTNDELLTLVPPNKIEVSPNFTCYKTLPNYLNNNGVQIVIDGIPYNKDYYSIDELKKLKQKCNFNHLAIKISTGLLAVAPNREDIINNDYNTQVFKNLGKKTHKELNDYIETQLAATKGTTKEVYAWIKLLSQFHMVQSGKYTHDRHNDCVWIDNRNENDEVIKSLVGYKIGEKTTYSRRRYASNKLTPKIIKQPIDRFQIRYIDAVYYDDITENNHKKGFRIKKLVTNSSDKSFFLLSSASSDFNTYKKDLLAKPLSSIDISDYQAPVRQSSGTKAVVVAKDFCAHYYQGYSLNPTQVNINSIIDTQVYEFIDSDTYVNRSNNKILGYMAAIGIKFFFVAKSAESQLKTNNKLVHLPDWIKQHKVSDQLIKAAIKLEIAIADMQSLIPVKDSIKNKTIKAILNVYAETIKVNYIAIPKEFNGQVKQYPLYKELAVVLADPSKFYKQLKNKYPLLKDFNSNHVKSDPDYAKDVINYLNNKR